MSLTLSDLLNPVASNNTPESSLFNNDAPQITHKYDSNDEGEVLDLQWSLSDIAKKRDVLIAYCNKVASPEILARMQKHFRDLDALELVKASLAPATYLQRREQVLQRIHVFLMQQDEIRKKDEEKLKRSYDHLAWSKWRVWLVVRVSWRLLDWFWKHEGMPLYEKRLRRAKIDPMRHAQNETSKDVFRLGFMQSWRTHFMGFWSRVLTHLPEGMDLKPHFAIVVVWLFLNCVGTQIGGVTLHALSERYTFFVQQNYIALFEDEYVAAIKKEGKSIEDFVSTFEIEMDTHQAGDVHELRKTWLQDLCGVQAPKIVVGRPKKKKEDDAAANGEAADAAAAETPTPTIEQPEHKCFSVQQMFTDACRISANLEELRHFNTFTAAQYLLERIEALAPEGDPTKFPKEGDRIKRRMRSILDSFKKKATNMHATRRHDNALRTFVLEVEVYAQLRVVCRTRVEDLIKLLKKNDIDLYEVMSDTSGMPENEIRHVFMTLHQDMKFSEFDKAHSLERIALTRSTLPPQPLDRLTLPFFDNYPVFKKWSTNESDEDILRAFPCDTCAHSSKTLYDYLTHMYEAHQISPLKYHDVSLRQIGNRLDNLGEDLGSELDVLAFDVTFPTEPLAPELYAIGSEVEKRSIEMREQRRTKLEMALILGVPYMQMRRLYVGDRKKKTLAHSDHKLVARKSTRDEDFMAIMFNLKTYLTFAQMATVLDMNMSQLKSRYYRQKTQGLDKLECVTSRSHLNLDQLKEWYENQFSKGAKVKHLEEVSKEDEEVQEPKTKGKRGRPRKATTTTTKKAATKEKQDTEEQSEPKPKSKRGRPRKATTTTTKRKRADDTGDTKSTKKQKTS